MKQFLGVSEQQLDDDLVVCAMTYTAEKGLLYRAYLTIDMFLFQGGVETLSNLCK